jgi:hypothetical protein
VHPSGQRPKTKKHLVIQKVTLKYSFGPYLDLWVELYFKLFVERKSRRKLFPSCNKKYVLAGWCDIFHNIHIQTC